MSKAFLKTLAKERHELLPLIIEFNRSPARYIHGSWIHPIIKPPFFEKLRKNIRSEKILSALVLRQFDLDQDHYFDFEDPKRRLALIDGKSLSRLVYLSGIVLNASRISKIIEREALLSLRNQIGDEAYLFALKKAPFLIGRMEFPFAEDQKSQDLQAHLIACGMKCLEACFFGERAALTKRLLFKLPKELCRNFGERPFGEGRDRAWSLLRRVLLQEVDPRWAPCFS